jgi:hypothetical protein
MHWYRFGLHTNHTLVSEQGFSADDLLQGRVGDCWFLSALAVIAERSDLIWRLFGNSTSLNFGCIAVNLFLDGYWKAVVVDNFLPCIMDHQGEGELQKAIQASLGAPTGTSFIGVGRTLNGTAVPAEETSASSSSTYNPHALSDKNRHILTSTNEFLQRDRAVRGTHASTNSSSFRQNTAPHTIHRLITSEDLAYSKAKKNQLWVVRFHCQRVLCLCWLHVCASSH